MPQEVTIRTTLTARGETIGGQQTITAGALTSIDEPIAPSASAAIELAIDVSALKALFITCDAPVSMEFEGPAVSMSLGAGEAFSWTIGLTPVPFESDVSGISVLNESDTDTLNFRCEVLQDPTP